MLVELIELDVHGIDSSWHCVCLLLLRPGSGGYLEVRLLDVCALTCICIEGILSSFSPLH